MGRIGRGWQLTKSSWQVLKLDKELTGLPIISFFASMAVLLAIGIGFFAAGGTSNNTSDSLNTGFTIALALITYFLLNLVANFFGGAIIYGATERFRGQDPTVGSSLRGARRKFGPLALFSLMIATVGLIFEILEDRLPFAGKIAAYIFDAAWSIANIFAVPVIVLTEEDVSPIEATKRSVQIIKQVWGESVIANLGIGVISFLTFVAYFAVWAAVAAGLSSAGVTSVSVGAPLVIIAILGFIVLAIIFTTLSSIIKAALYHYATTGQAPASFDTNLLQASMTPKKTRKVF
jgi:hypothetical protein